MNAGVEWRRIFTRKSMMCAMLFLFVLNLILYKKAVWNDEEADLSVKAYRAEFMEQLKGMTDAGKCEAVEEQLEKLRVFIRLYDMEQIRDTDYDEYLLYFEEDELLLREEYPELVSEYERNQDVFDIDAIRPRFIAIAQIYAVMEYQAGYKERIEEIKEEAAKISNISIFRTVDEYSAKNIEKTVQDYQGIYNLELQVSEDSEYGITLFWQYDMKDYCFFLFMLLIAFGMYAERKRGLWSSVYATAGGRLRLGARRIGILLGSAVAGVIMFHGSILVFGLLRCGTNVGWGRPVQSVPLFADFTYQLSLGQFICLYFLYRVLCGFLVAMLAVCICGIFRNHTVGLLFLGVFFALSYMLHQGIEDQNSLQFLRYCNVYYYMVSGDMFTTYHNINIRGEIFDRILLVAASAVSGCILLCICYLLIVNYMKPVVSLNIIGRAFQSAFRKLQNLLNMIVEKLPFSLKEGYKIFIMQRGMVVVLLAAVYLFLTLDTTEKYFNNRDAYIREFYEDMGGVPDEESREYVRQQREEMDAIEEEFVRDRQMYLEGQLDAASYYQSKDKYEISHQYEDAVALLEQQMVYLDNLKEEKGIEGWLLFTDTFDKWIGTREDSGVLWREILQLFCLVLIVSGIFSFEYQSTMKHSLHTARGGRGPLFWKKTMWILLTAVFIELLFGAVDALNIYFSYGYNGILAPVQSLPSMYAFSPHCSILQFIIILSVIRAGVLAASGMIAGMVSACLKTVQQSLVVNTVLWVLPSVLYTLGLTIFKWVSLVVPLNFMMILLDIHPARNCTAVICLLAGMALLALYAGNSIWCKRKLPGVWRRK